MKLQLRRAKSDNLVFAGLLTLVLLASASVASAQLVVNTLADSGPGSLRAAIENANNDGVPTTIIFDPAVFPAAAPGVILLASALPILTGTGDTIDGTGAGVVIEGISLSSSSDSGFRVQQGNITIRGLTIQNFPDRAIRVEAVGTAVSGVVIDNNIFINNFGGIRVDGTGLGNSTLTITNNTALNNVRNGIAILAVSSGNTQDTLTVLIDNNTANGSPSGNGVAITAETGGASFKKIIATISNNNLTDNDDNGVFVAPCGNGAGAGTNNAIDVTLINNTVKRNGSPGIFVSADNNGTCQDNTVNFEISSNAVFDNGAVNIEVSGGGGAGHDVQGSISNNTIKDDKQWPFVDPTTGLPLPPGDGLNVSGGSGTGNRVHDVTISGNTVTGNNRGILVNGGTNSVNAVLDGIDIVGNTVKDSASQGILVSGGTNSRSAIITDVLIDGNTSMGNASRGIQITRGSNVSTLPPSISLAGITNNAASKNSDDGILISSNVPGSGTTPISGNQANFNLLNGIELRSTGYLVSNNTASSNNNCGIILGGNTDSGGNTAKKNGQCDIAP